MLNVNDLTVEYHRNAVKAVDNVRLKIPDSCIFALLGESGCGKTTLGLSLTRLISDRDAEITSGSVVFNNENIFKFPRKRLQDTRGKRISYIFQEPASALNPVFTIGEQIREALLAHKITAKEDAKKAAIESLRRARLDYPERVYNSYPYQLSGGMKQRAMIAMAICTRPKLLVADEPTTALDTDTEDEILKLILELRKELLLSVLFITHDIRIVLKIADKVAVMREGRIVEVGDTQKVLRTPKHEYTKMLLFSMPERLKL